VVIAMIAGLDQATMYGVIFLGIGFFTIMIAIAEIRGSVKN